MVSEQVDPPACSLPSLPRLRFDSVAPATFPFSTAANPTLPSPNRSAPMATTPSPYPAFPSATTYPPHPYGCYYPPPIPYPSSIQIHDGYYPAPPYLAGYGSSPPTFPNPHPTSAYAPPPGLVPIPTYAPAPAPPQPSPNHQHPPGLWSPPPMPSSVSFPFRSGPSSAYEQSSHPVLPDSSYQDVLTKDTGTLFRDNAGPKNCIFVEEDATVQEVTDERVPTTDVTPHRLQQQQREQIFNDIQGQLAKLTEMASQLTVYIGKRSVSAPRSTPAASAAVPACAVSQVFGELPTPSSCNGTGSTSPASSTPSTDVVVTQLFGEMPRPIYCPRKYSSPLHYYEEQETPVLSPFLSEGNNNLSEQNIHGMPQSYGFSNLNRQSIVLADGTKRSYFTLPADYSLEQAVPAPVFDVDDVDTKGCTDEYVDVCACNPCRQPSEEEQYESRQAPERFSKPTVGVFNLANELNPDTEPMAVCVNKASANAFSQYATEFTSILVPRLIVDEPIKCSVRKLKTELHSLPESALCYTHGNPKHVKNQQCNMQIGEQGREVWDPGALLPLMSSTTQHYSPALQPASDATAQGRRDAAAVYKVLILQLPMSTNSLVWDPGIDTPSSIYFWLQDLSTRIATRKPLPWLQISELATWRSQVASASYVWDPGTESLLFLCKLLHIRMIQLVDSTSTTSHACYFFLVARLPPTQVASYCLSNIKVVELTSRYLVFHPNQIDSWASTISNGIASSEYAYRLDFHYDQWEFFNQQDVHENCSAKHLLLSSQKYLLLREMDIIFITYLPP